MLDDTCYFVGFDDICDAVATWAILNSDISRRLIRSVTFIEDKRPYTKQTLMRVGLAEIAQDIFYDDISAQIRRTEDKLTEHFTRQVWDDFKDRITQPGLPIRYPSLTQQLSLF
ncbi:hypothetical protein [Desulfonema magnum]|nr:hypothetical protein [Desulfonema magnum]